MIRGHDNCVCVTERCTLRSSLRPSTRPHSAQRLAKSPCALCGMTQHLCHAGMTEGLTVFHCVNPHAVHTVLTDDVGDPQIHAADDVLVFRVNIHEHNVRVVKRVLLNVSLCAWEHSICVIQCPVKVHLVVVVRDEAAGTSMMSTHCAQPMLQMGEKPLSQRSH